MRIYPAPHYTMGGLWVDYNLMTTVPGLFAIGESNFSDHGANRLGAGSLMQCAGDGYFILPVTIGDFLADRIKTPRMPVDGPEFDAAEQDARDRLDRLMAINGKQTVTAFHKRLGRIMWDDCGMVRNEAGLMKAQAAIADLKEEFWRDVKVPGRQDRVNQELEKAVKVADFLELGQLMCRDALARIESCGAHFREESQTPEGEAQRIDAEFSHVAAWEYAGAGAEHVAHKEPLTFENVEIKERSYK
jgi:succinate dehydrogenase / fumarate reductase, flavoprotein subunit